MASREQRMEENERSFRDANERLGELVGRAGVGKEQLVPFLCECADDECLGRVQITLDRYAEVHIDRDAFVILPGHPRMESEEILETTDYYEVTKKAA
jgi:hypothetical protein